MQSASDWFDAAAELLSRLGVRFVKAGALAAAEYRLAERGTTDADVLVEWDERLVPALEGDGYAIRQAADPGEHPHLLIARRGEARVDFIVAGTEYQSLAIKRGESDHTLTIEDVLIHKLIAWRPKDRDDIVSILERGLDFDDEYVEHWATEWDVVDRWHSVWPR